MIMVTSWNEWNEDTAIEPVAESPARSRDITGEGYTQGYEYSGYDTRYLEIIRDKVVAICGRVLGQAGEPVAGCRVSASSAEVTIDAETDTYGYYRLSRLKMNDGTWDVSVAGADGVDVVVQPSVAATGVNFTVVLPAVR